MQDTPIIEKTNAFDHVALWYPERLFSATVRSAAHYDKRAQDKTTVRTSEFTFHSDGLSLWQTVQPDNALAVTTTHFTYDALGRAIREDRPDGTRVATEYDYDDSQSVTNPCYGLSATSKYRMATTGSVAPPSATGYDRVGQSIRARTVGFDTRMAFYPAGNGLCTNNVFDANQTLERIYVTPTSGGSNLLDHRYKFYSSGNLTQRADKLKNLTENMAYDRLNRLTDAIVVGVSTVAISYDDLGNTTNRTPNSGLSGVSAYGHTTGSKSCQ